MTRFFVPDDFLQVILKVDIRDTGAEAGAEVVFFDAEKAGTDFAVRGEAEAVAVPAERFADRGDDADFGIKIKPKIGSGNAPAFGGFGLVGREDRFQMETGLEALEDFVAGDDKVFLPCVTGVERHELDEAHVKSLPLRELNERFEFVVVQAADDHGIDLDRIEAEFLRKGDAGENFMKSVAAGDLFEIVRVKGIQAEADASEPGIGERAGLLLEEKTISCERQIFDAGNRCKAFDQEFDVLAQQRLAAGETDLFDAKIDCKADNPLDFFEAQDMRTRRPLTLDGSGGRVRVRPAVAIEIRGRFSLRQAIEATKVAAIRYTDPEVTQNASVRINQHIAPMHQLTVIARQRRSRRARCGRRRFAGARCSSDCPAAQNSIRIAGP